MDLVAETGAEGGDGSFLRCVKKSLRGISPRWKSKVSPSVVVDDDS
jgi:hypothetical protein